jgi:hypothetical protein
VLVRLRPVARELGRVSVHAGRSGGPRATAFGRAALDVAAGAGLPNPAGDPFQLVRLVPGVSGEDVGSDFRLRGGGADETLVRLDGLEVRSLFHGRDFGGVTGIVPLGIVEGLDVHPVAAPVGLGSRTSGAIDVALRDRGAPGTHGSFAADLTSARALLERHGDAGSLFVSAREGYLHRVLGAIQSDAVVEPAYRDVLLRAVRRTGSATLSGNYLLVQDRVLFEDGIPSHSVDAEYRDHAVWGGARWLASSRVAARGTAFAALSSVDRLRGAGSVEDRDSRRVGGRLQVAVAAGSHVLEAGAEAEREWTDGLLRASGIVHVLPDGRVAAADDIALRGVTDRMAAWIQDEWSATSRLTLGGGLRASRDTASDDAVLVTRGGAALALGTGWSVRAAWGRYAQAPRLEPAGRGDLLVVSGRVQQAEHAGVGLEKRIAGVVLGVEAWKKRFDPLDAVVGRTVAGEIEQHVITRGSSRGLETHVRREGRSAQWWLAYSLGRSRWSDGARTYTRDFDALHSLALANTHRLGANWDVGVTYRYHSGTPYTRQTWRRDASQYWILDEGALNAERLPDYHRVDVRVRCHFRFDGCEASLWAEALNLTNHDNVLWYGWRLRDPEGAIRARAECVRRTGLPGLPSVGLEVRF